MSLSRSPLSGLPPEPDDGRHTNNSPFKEVIAVAETREGWRGVLGKLTAAGTPTETAPTFLEELARTGTLAKK